ncbi:MAG: hypothetical protein ACRD4F_02460, partial [Candidatus Angelobacter sp.]
IGMISLGDLAVKSEEDEASDALGDISEGVRTDGRSHQQVSGRQTHGQAQRRRQSSGERVAEDEAEYQRKSGQSGSDRAESAQAGRTRNQSRSQQTIANDIVNAEGEEEPEFQNAGGGNARQRGNQQQASVRGRHGSSHARGESTQSATRTQGASNRSQREESQRQQKVTPMRAETSNPARNRGKRKVS